MSKDYIILSVHFQYELLFNHDLQFRDINHTIFFFKYSLVSYYKGKSVEEFSLNSIECNELTEESMVHHSCSGRTAVKTNTSRISPFKHMQDCSEEKLREEHSSNDARKHCIQCMSGVSIHTKTI